MNLNEFEQHVFDVVVLPAPDLLANTPSLLSQSSELWYPIRSLVRGEAAAPNASTAPPDYPSEFGQPVRRDCRAVLPYFSMPPDQPTGLLFQI